jgi:hypothetical protein
MRARLLGLLLPVLLVAETVALAAQDAPPPAGATLPSAAGPPSPVGAPPALPSREVNEIAPPRSTLKRALGDGSAPRQRMVTVFGTEPCPKPTSPDEVVVCARLPESEIYRIPDRLRQAERQVTPFQSNRSLLLGDASGAAGGSIGSCSAVGPGGQIGCSRNQIDAWAKDRAGRMAVTEELPPE